MLLAISLGLTPGCSAQPSPNSLDVSLVDHLAWATTVDSSTALATHRPDEVNCPDSSWREEDGSLEVDTSTCNYLALSQPAAAEVRRGQPIHIVLWHDRLDAEDEGEAHIAITLKDEVLWEQFIPIPSEAVIYDQEVDSGTNLSQGEPIGLHLHNHGSNSWNVLKITRLGS